MAIAGGFNKPSDLTTLELINIHAQFLPDTSGTVATYIPSLAAADPNKFGIAVASLAGKIYQVGDSKFEHTIQSVSKPFVYALALEDLGLKEVLSRVAAEPSGEAFNAISLQEDGRPPNPMVNAGAIVTTSLVIAETSEQRFERIRQCLSKFAGRELQVDQTVYECEMLSGDRNRALAYLLRNAGSLTGSVTETLECYFKQCSLLVSACDLAVMGATLANGGLNPFTGVTAVSRENAQHVLTIIATCGMYNSAGTWLLHAGLPAKSGVSGALVASCPDMFGIGLYSPLLGPNGNSIRSVKAVYEISKRFGLHFMHQHHRTNVEVIRKVGNVKQVHTGISMEVLNQHCERIFIVVLQGEIDFSRAEAVLLELDSMPVMDRQQQWVVLEVSLVTEFSQIALGIFSRLLSQLARQTVSTIIVDVLNRQLIPTETQQYISRQEAVQYIINQCEVHKH